MGGFALYEKHMEFIGKLKKRSEIIKHRRG